MSDWQNLGASGLYVGAESSGVRSELDARRMGVGRIPSAEYPDGYIGTLANRRGDRLQDAVQTKVTQKSYQRGVHKGERIDPGDYVWPANAQPDRGLIAQSKGLRTSLIVGPDDVHLVNSGRGRPMGPAAATPNPTRVSQLQSLRPSWR